MRKLGTMKNWNEVRGFGFVRPDDGTPDLFVHRTEIRGYAKGSKAKLVEGQRIEFEITQSDRGPRAADVVELPG